MKKKIGLLVGYNGEGYHGLQFNKNLKTIEKDIINILLQNECITELNSQDAQKIDLKSSSRTDRGVHASFNVVQAKIIKEMTPELLHKLKNDFKDIGMVLYKIIPLPKSFISYKQARSRVYKYIVPTFFLQESNFKEEYESFLNKYCLDTTTNEAEKARHKEDKQKEASKKFKSAGNTEVSSVKINNIDLETNEKETLDSYCDNPRTNTDVISKKGQMNAENSTVNTSQNKYQKNMENSGNKGDESSDEFEKNKKVFLDYSADDISPIENYRSNSIECFRSIMSMYVGTHNFHNFTLKKTPGDSKRHMMSIKVSEPFYNEEIEFVQVKIHGQSFLLHQIRKMISFAVLNCKFSRANYRKNFESAFSTSDIHIPKCPSEYLFLNHIFFNDFNQKRKETAEDQIDINEEEKQSYEKEKIYPSIFKNENLYEWFKFVGSVYRNYDKFDFFL